MKIKVKKSRNLYTKAHKSELFRSIFLSTKLSFRDNSFYYQITYPRQKHIHFSCSMAARRAAKKALNIYLGQCVPSVKTQASKIRIRKMELDENLLMVI